MKLEYLIPSLAVIGLLLSTLVFAQEQEQETTIPVSATVEKYMLVTVSYAAVDFGTVIRTTVANPPVNLVQTFGQFNATVVTNYDYKMQARVSPVITGLTHRFNAHEYLPSAIDYTLAKSLTDIYIDIYTRTIPEGAGYIEYHGHFLDVGDPKGGTYSWTLYMLWLNL